MAPRDEYAGVVGRSQSSHTIARSRCGEISNAFTNGESVGAKPKFGLLAL